MNKLRDIFIDLLLLFYITYTTSLLVMYIASRFYIISDTISACLILSTAFAIIYTLIKYQVRIDITFRYKHFYTFDNRRQEK